MAGRARGRLSGGAVLALLITFVAFLAFLVFLASSTAFAIWSGALVSRPEDRYIVAESTLAAQEHEQKEAWAVAAAEHEERNVELRRLHIADEKATDMGFAAISSGFYDKCGVRVRVLLLKPTPAPTSP
jgi:hypothetical protein